MKKFKTKSELEKQLSSDIISWINQAIIEYGSAHLLLSGGSTPLDLYSLIGENNLDPKKVKIGLVDERFVPYESEFNNQHNIETALNKSGKSLITVVPMVINGSDSEENLRLVNESYKPFFERIDFCILGMGEDGHTASIFPDDEASNDLITHTTKGIFNTSAPNYPNERISCNKVMLTDSKNMVLMLVGDKKMKAYENAILYNLPISHFANGKNELTIYMSTL